MLPRLPVEDSSMIASTIARVTNPSAIKNILTLLFFRYAKIDTNPRKTEIFKLTMWIIIWYIIDWCKIWGIVKGMMREETITVVSAKNLSLLSSILYLLCNCTLTINTVTRFKLIGTLIESTRIWTKKITVFFVIVLAWMELASNGQSNVRT
jgi:hypothetical protein